MKGKLVWGENNRIKGYQKVEVEERGKNWSRCSSLLIMGEMCEKIGGVEKTSGQTTWAKRLKEKQQQLVAKIVW